MHITIDHAELQLANDAPWWCLTQDLVHNDGREVAWSHFMPDDIFEWRVVEYGFNSGDMDQLLEVALYEPWLPAGDPDLTHFTAPTVRKAREYHWSRIQKLKGDGLLLGRPGKPRRFVAPEHRDQLVTVLLDSGTEDPLETVKRESPMSTAHLAVKAEMIAQHRERHQRERRDRRSDPGWSRETPEQLRARIMPLEGGTGKPIRRHQVIDVPPPPQLRRGTT